VVNIHDERFIKNVEILMNHIKDQKTEKGCITGCMEDEYEEENVTDFEIRFSRQAAFAIRYHSLIFHA
jgi:hypothetical protein